MTARIQVFHPDDVPAPQPGQQADAATAEDGMVDANVAHRGRAGGGGLERHRVPIDPGVPDLNLSYSYGWIRAGYFSPRHRHNFDQIRYTLRGNANFGRRELRQDECGYFPEGAAYGPQDQKDEVWNIVFQFPGPSGAYLMSGQEVRDATVAARAAGVTFENGVYRAKTADGRTINKDSYEALWENHTGLELRYPKPRYPEWVVMRSEAFSWTPDPSRPGVDQRKLGTFTEWDLTVAMWRMAPGATIPSEVLSAPQIRFVMGGSVQYGGRDLPENSTLYIPEDVSTEPLSSATGAQMHVITMPQFTRANWLAARDQLALAAA